LNRLQIHLKPLAREGKVEVWNDTLLQPGTKWEEKIRQALTRAKVAVLLVSADFMASDFIAHEELSPLLVAAETDGAVILPVIISPSWFEKTALARFQAVNPPSKPLIRMSKARQEEIWLKVAEEIHKTLNAVGGVSQAPPDSLRTMPTFSPSIYSTTLKPEEQDVLSPKVSISYSRPDEKLKELEAAARLRGAYEVQLTKVKGYRRGWATPRCYISYLPEQAAWAAKLIHDLRDAGVYVVEQAAQIQPDDFVIVLDTPAYQKAFITPLLSADAPLIQARLGKRRQLISLALTGQAKAHEFEDCELGSFCDETHYPVSLFNLVLNLYNIPLTHAGFAPLRQALHAQWEQTLARKKGDDATSLFKIFISYSHKDEEFKDELVTMLAGLQRQGIIDAWQDRRSEEGDEWYQAIQDAMNDCDLAILLVSQHFIASRFIQDEELQRLLQRRREDGLRVVPIIVRPCKWQSEPALSGIQGLPKDGKAVITFSKDNGERDQVWADIATVIEKRAKTKITP
ncbi:MAG: toll/interleukin-1 receptor domain-containing protein, partial [Pyrinomonadaceae bacterium]